MKNFKKLKTLLLLLICSGAALAQVPVVPTFPADSFTNFFESIGMAAPAVLFITAFINSKLRINAGYKQFTSWVVAMLGAFIGYFMEWGIYTEASIIETVIYGLSVGLLANGIFDIKAIQKFLTVLGVGKIKK